MEIDVVFYSSQFSTATVWLPPCSFCIELIGEIRRYCCPFEGLCLWPLLARNKMLLVCNRASSSIEMPLPTCEMTQEQRQEGIVKFLVFVYVWCLFWVEEADGAGWSNGPKQLSSETNSEDGQVFSASWTAPQRMWFKRCQLQQPQGNWHHSAEYFACSQYGSPYVLDKRIRLIIRIFN